MSIPDRHIQEFYPETDDRTEAETDFSPQRRFFERLEKELKGAKRAGYDYLTVFGPDSGGFYFGLVINAEFIPHNEEGKFEDEIPRCEVTTYPIGGL